MKEQSYQATVNAHFEFKDLENASLDILPTGTKTFHIIKNGTHFNAEVLSLDFAKKTIVLKINGSSYEIQLADQYDQLVKKLGLSVANAQKVKELKAPMPGLVLNILAAPGQDVQKGEPLFILEAMKMENIIKSPGDGTLKNIHVTIGAPVDKGQLLVDFE